MIIFDEEEILAQIACFLKKLGKDKNGDMYIPI